jgi:hypothetical protein
VLGREGEVVRREYKRDGVEEGDEGKEVRE